MLRSTKHGATWLPRRNLVLMNYIAIIGFAAGLVLWVAYGFLLHSLPIMLPNAVTFFLAFPLLVMKLRFNKSETTAPRADNREVAEVGY